ncbi:hypothetical protein QCA50_001269 [Cerrena zonata]|uniref:F-box domain-containing protein n=1 Tax=Cerrena zonata TaxID=2478898 RepID=A0AAW0GVC9_9APHY
MTISVFRREPTAAEIAEAETEIQTHEQTVAQLTKQIQSLHTQITSLRTAQADHFKAMYRHKGVITLARRIPPELLARIFRICVKDGWYMAPAVVSHVCSQWREAARSPRVWSRIYLNLDDCNAFGRTRFWLKMASHAPLHITLISTWKIRAPLFLDAMGLLLRHAAEWKSFTLEVDLLQHMQLVALCIDQSSTKFHQLKRMSLASLVPFELNVDNLDGVTIDLAGALSLEKAPNLVHLSVTCNAVPTTVTFPSQAQVLDLTITESSLRHPLSARSIISLLTSMPLLTHLRMSMPLEYEGEYIDDGDPDGVTLPNLISLVLYGPTNMNGLLYQLHIPSLRRLHLRSLEDRGFRQDPIGPSLLHLIRDTGGYLSSSSIETVELYDIDLSPQYFASCFAALPNLRELRLHECSISDATLRLLQAGFFNQEASGCLCPKLSRIDLRWCTNITGRAVVDLVRSRVPNRL